MAMACLPSPPIKKGEEVIEYKGTLMTHAEADDLYGDGGETGHTFLFTLNDEYIDRRQPQRQ